MAFAMLALLVSISDHSMLVVAVVMCSQSTCYVNHLFWTDTLSCCAGVVSLVVPQDDCQVVHDISASLLMERVKYR